MRGISVEGNLNKGESVVKINVKELIDYLGIEGMPPLNKNKVIITGVKTVRWENND